MSAAALDTQDPYQGLSSEGLPEALRLGEPVTDATHAEFLQLLDAAARADDAGFLEAYDAWIDHTRHHFAQEELSGWFDQHVKSMDAMMVEHMQANGFTLIEGPQD
jgi:hemerythrin